MKLQNTRITIEFKADREDIELISFLNKASAPDDMNDYIKAILRAEMKKQELREKLRLKLQHK